MMLPTILLLLFQFTLTPDLCGPGDGERTISKGEVATLCWQAEYSDRLQWFRIRRAPVMVGLYSHFWKVLPAVAVRQTFNGKDWYVVRFDIKPDKTYHYCVSTVYLRPETGTVEQETPCSEHVLVTVK